MSRLLRMVDRLEQQLARDGLPRKPWKFDCGNQQVEEADGRMPIVDLCTMNDLGGHTHECVPHDTFALGEFLELVSPHEMAELCRLVRKEVR